MSLAVTNGGYRCVFRFDLSYIFSHVGLLRVASLFLLFLSSDEASKSCCAPVQPCTFRSHTDVWAIRRQAPEISPQVGPSAHSVMNLSDLTDAWAPFGLSDCAWVLPRPVVTHHSSSGVPRSLSPPRRDVAAQEF